MRAPGWTRPQHQCRRRHSVGERRWPADLLRHAAPTAGGHAAYPQPAPKVDTPPKVDTRRSSSCHLWSSFRRSTCRSSSRPPDAEVYIDGNLVGHTLHKLPHKRGILVRVEVRKRGFEPYYEELTPDSSQTL